MRILKKYVRISVIITIISLLNINNVFATELSTYYISETIHNRTFTVIVSFTKNVAAAGTIQLSYDTDKLTLLSSEQGTAKAQMITINDKSKGTISINFLNTKGEVTDDTNLAVLEFNIISENIKQDDIFSESYKLYDINGKLVSNNKNSKLIYQMNTQNVPSDISVENKGGENSQVESDISKSEQEKNSTEDISVVSQSSSIEVNSGIENSKEESTTSLVSSVHESSTVISENTDNHSSILDEDTEQELTVQNSENSFLEQENDYKSRNSQADENNENTNILWIVVVVAVLAVGCIVMIMIRKQKSN